MKALEEEMVDTEPAEDLEQYTSKESFGSSLGSLLAGTDSIHVPSSPFLINELV